MIGARLRSPNPPNIFSTLSVQCGTVAVGILTVLIWLTVGGCTTPPPQQRSHIANSLLGKTKQELVACAGTPLKEFAHPDATVLVYYKEAPALEESFMGSKSSVLQGRHGCRARISLRNDQVEGVEYESVPAAFASEDHCDEIFQTCGH